MAQWRSHCNQKLYQARLLLDRLTELEEASDDASNVGMNAVEALTLTSALQESTLFQMVLAYQAYLHEIAEIAQCRDSFMSLDQLLAKTPIATGEMLEFKKLEEDSFSWLSQLLYAFQSCGEKDALTSKAAGTQSMIQIQDTTSAALPLREWLKQLNDIIDLQRNNSQES